MLPALGLTGWLSDCYTRRSLRLRPPPTNTFSPAMPGQTPLLRDFEFFQNFEELFDPELLSRARALFEALCETLDRAPPQDLPELYGHTLTLTQALNELQAEGLCIETDEREAFAEAVGLICEAYGFSNADIEEAIANRDW